MNDPNKTTGSPGGVASGDAADLVMPTQIGRYRIEKVLGEGGFGLVFLAYDEQLERSVAIKVRHPELVASSKASEAYFIEARTVANLDHPHIVPVYDVGSTDEFPCFVVSKFIDGTDLSKRLKKSRLSIREAIELVATIADALHYAHKRGLVHRDVKPGNVLLEKGGKPYLADFGIALSEREMGKGPRYVGSPPYMSPEQARGEGHRVDGRSDIFSLGTVLYELITGRQPFKGDTQQELLDQVTGYEPRPPRQWDDGITKELERICLKALSKRASERYTTAKDFADDLRQYLAGEPVSQTPSSNPSGVVPVLPSAETMGGGASSDTGVKSDSQLIKIVPKGLRSFDAHDSDFFLELLPGPRDREGLPDSIRFWKSRIEEQDPDNTFPVGLIYGPSGCGKSSLMKAGLLPRLSPTVTAIYVEARASDTETRLLAALRKHCPQLPPEIGLKDALAALRRGDIELPTDKLVIILDQFEQWLHAQRGEPDGELVQALRQCDGGRVQCVIMVRDDFWMGITRFLTGLEIELLQGQNCAAADLFDLDHAQKVLAALGRAFGKLPPGSGEMTKDQREFLKQVVSGLAQDDKIVCIRLALFAEMMKGKPWTTATLKEIGGTEGVGVTFLEETFSSSMANPKHRMYQREAQAVLSALLPERGTDIKGHMRSHTALKKAAGLVDKPQHFESLLRILDSEIRLITPTDWEGKDGDENASHFDEAEKYYQLTHDYLVPALRDWLTRKQKETKRGRAELLLADQAAIWNSRPENRQLPSIWQVLQICWLTSPRNWTPLQRKMMRRAAQVHAIRSAIIIGMLVLMFRTSYEGQGRRNAATFRDGMLRATSTELSSMLKAMPAHQRWLVPMLHESLAEAQTQNDRKKALHASLGLLPTDPGQLQYLYQRLLEATPYEIGLICSQLALHHQQAQEPLRKNLWAVLKAPPDRPQRLRAAAALATFDPDSAGWHATSCRAIVDDLVHENSVHLSYWSRALHPIRRKLFERLTEVYSMRHPDKASERLLATYLLADYADEDAAILADLLMEADEKQFLVIYPKLEQRFDACRKKLLAALSAPLPSEPSSEDREALGRRRANAALALCKKENNHDEIWKLLAHSADPTARSFLVHRLAPLKGDIETLLKRLSVETDISVRRALHLSLGEFNADYLSKLSGDESQSVKTLVKSLQDLYVTEDDPGLHASAEWLLRQWGHEKWLKEKQKEWTKDAAGRKTREDKARAKLTSNDAARQWYVTGQGHTMVVIPGPVKFMMGSPAKETGRADPIYGIDVEQQHEQPIERHFALATTAVTVAQYKKHKPGNNELGGKYKKRDDQPIVRTSWSEAAEYCNWLSKLEGIPESQWCYREEMDGDEKRFFPKPNCMDLTGYRLPTEAEYEYAARAGSATSRYYGEPEELLANYAWYQRNSDDQTHPVGQLKPNDFGFFDMHGNVFTWCEELNPLMKLKYWNRPVDEDLRKGYQPSRMLRGSSFFNLPSISRSAYRYFIAPGIEINYSGFRVARTMKPDQTK